MLFYSTLLYCFCWLSLIFLSGIGSRGNVANDHLIPSMVLAPTCLVSYIADHVTKYESKCVCAGVCERVRAYVRVCVCLNEVAFHETCGLKCWVKITWNIWISIFYINILNWAIHKKTQATYSENRLTKPDFWTCESVAFTLCKPCQHSVRPFLSLTASGTGRIEGQHIKDTR